MRKKEGFADQKMFVLPGSVAKSLISNDITEALYLTDLAGYCDLSVSHFSLVFRQTTGRSPLDYLIHLRIQRACNLLDLSGLKVKEVAARVGFEDVFYFSRVFRRVMGLSPSAYRKVKKG